MSSPLNSPLEVGMRVLVLLAQAFPSRIDINRLVLLDHGLLHSADLGGPASLHPPLPIRSGELGIRRRTIEDGLEVMVRAGLVEMSTGDSGIEFWASETAEGFLRLLVSDYAGALQERASWVTSHFFVLDDEELRTQMKQVSQHWSEEFEIQSVPHGGDV